MKMLRSLKAQLSRAAISIAMKTPAPSIIPMSRDLETRNYCGVNLGDKDDPWKFVVTGVGKQGVTGLWFSAREPGEASIGFGQLPDYSVTIVLYLQELELRYSSQLEFIFD